MKTTKRILSLLLCLAMVFSVIPAFAMTTKAADATEAAAPNADVTVLDPMTLPAGEYMCWDGSLTEGDIDRPLQIVMNFKANDTVDEARANGFSKYLCDFYLTFSGLETGALTADNCYLAGNYGTFGWIVIPTDGLKLEEGICYPVVSAYDANITYKQICESVKDFTAAIYVDEAILEANPNFKVKLELKMTNPDDANDVIVVGEPAIYDVEDLMGRNVPNADVTVLDPMTLPAGEYMCWDGSLTEGDIDRPLQIVMNFKANDTVDEARANGFSKYLCDFYLTFSGLETGALTADNCYLAGNYGTFGWIVIPTDGLELEEGVCYPVVSAYDANITYKQICETVKDFTAAIYVDEAILEANPNFSVKLELKMTNPNDANDVIVVGDPAIFTAADLMEGNPTYVAQIGDKYFTTIEAALEAAQAGDTIVLLTDLADIAIEVNKNITISGDVTLNNVSINAVEGATELTVSGLTFIGNSWINSGAANKLTVSGVTANVTPKNTSYTNSRGAFISLGRSEQTKLALVVENCNIVSAGGTDPILGWAQITEATITGSTFGSPSAYQNNSDSIKFMSIADGALFTITGNTIYSNYNGIVFAQNTTRNNAYTAVIENNQFFGGADHIWIEISGGSVCNGTFKIASNNTVNGNAFTASDIKAHTGVIKSWSSYAGVDVVTDVSGKLIGGTMAFVAADAIAAGYELNEKNEVVAKLPDATVSVKDPMVLTPEDNYICWPNGDKTINRPLQIVMNFKANDTVDEARANGFSKYLCDFYLTFSGLETGALTADNCYLAGNYGTFGWIVIPTDGLELEEGVCYPVVSAYDANITYKQICETVKDFTAAIYVDEAILEANPNFKVTLELKMTNPDDANDVIVIGEPAVYTAADLMAGEPDYVAKIGNEKFASLEEALNAAQPGDTIDLYANVTSSDIIIINKAITINGNGKTLTSTAGRAINVSGADGVTIKNLTINASGERAINIIQNATNVTIENVTATAANYTVNLAASAPNAVVAIKDSTLNGLCTVNVSAANAEVTIDNSTINCNDNNTTVGESYAALSLNKDAVGGSIIATNTTVNVTEGSDSNKGRNGAENGVVTINGSTDGVIVVVAAITYAGSDYYYTYTSLEAAIAAAKAGDTITLIRDITSKDIIVIDKAITLDGNGHKLTSTAGRAINVSGADGATIKNLTIDAKGERAINIIQNATNVTIENVTATAANYAVNVASSAPNAEVAIKDSKLTGLNVVNVAAAGANVTVVGGTLTCNDQTTAENYAALKLNPDATGAKIVALGITFDIKGDSNKASNAAKDGVITIDGSEDGIKKAVAYISYGSNAYTFYSLQDAIEYAKAGETIVMLAPAVVEKGETLTLDKDVTITYTSNAVGVDMITVRGTLNVAAGKITYTNTDKTGNNVTVSTISCEPGSVLNVTGGTIENKTVYSTGSYAYAIDMLTNGSLGDVTATISGGVVYSDYMAIRQFNNGTACKNSLTISGGEIYGAKRAIQVHLNNDAAYLAISGGVIEAGEGGYALCLFPTNATNIAVTGGKFIASVYSATNGIISGGIYTEAVEEAYIAEGYELVTNDDGTYGVEEALVDSDLVFAGEPGLSFQDYIGLQILFQNKKAKNYDSFYVEITQVDFEGNVTTTQTTGTPYGSSFTFFEQQILSWSMTEQVTMTLYGVKDGVAYKGQSFTTSVEALALEKIPSYVSSGDMARAKALVDMLNFGSAVQTAYDHNATDLPNAELGDLAQYGTTGDPEFTAVNDITGTNSITVYSNNISMQSKVEFQFMVKTTALEGKTVVAKMGDTDATVAYEPMGTFTIIRVACGAAYMRENFTIVVNDANGNAVTCTYNVTVEAYAAAQLNGEKAPAMKALLTYGDAVSQIPV